MKNFEVIFKNADGDVVFTGTVQALGYRSAITAAQDRFKADGGKMADVVEVHIGMHCRG